VKEETYKRTKEEKKWDDVGVDENDMSTYDGEWVYSSGWAADKTEKKRDGSGVQTWLNG
jgi:hypothetical protein